MTVSTHPLLNQLVVITKGCTDLGLPKNHKGRVTSITPMGADYSHSVKVSIYFGSRTVTLFARHLNRLSDAEFNLNNGNPTKKITVRPTTGMVTGTVRSKTA